jgi:hypothetical protein
MVFDHFFQPVENMGIWIVRSSIHKTYRAIRPMAAKDLREVADPYRGAGRAGGRADVWPGFGFGSIVRGVDELICNVPRKYVSGAEQDSKGAALRSPALRKVRGAGGELCGATGVFRWGAVVRRGAGIFEGMFVYRDELKILNKSFGSYATQPPFFDGFAACAI